MARKKARKRASPRTTPARPTRPARTAGSASFYRETLQALEAGRPEEALAAADQLVKLDPRAACFTLRGLARRGLGDLQGALEDLDHAVAVEPGLPGAHDARALLYFDLLRWEEARDELSRYLELRGTPETDFLHLRLWLVRTRLREPKADARLRVRAARVAESTHPAREWWGAIASHLLGDLSLAELRAKASTPEQRCEAGFFAGARCFVLGDEAGARESLERCIEQGVTAFTEHQSAVALEAALSSRPNQRWVLWRQGDDGPPFEVERYPSRETAEAAQQALEARGHKQRYWVDELATR